MHPTAIVFLTLSLAGPSPGLVTLQGSTLDGAGGAVADALVVLAESKPVLGTRPVVLDCGRSDGKGEFRVQLATEPEDRYRELRPHTLWAWAPGRALVWRSVPRDAPAEPGPVSFILGRAPQLEVLVLAPDGRPAGGIRVSPGMVSGRLLPETLADKLTVRTDGRGRAVLSGVAAQDLLNIRVIGDGSGMQQLPLPPPGSGGVYTLTLGRAGRVEGRITAPEPEACRGLTVHLSTKADPSDDDWAGGFAEARTDHEGRFAAPAIAEGALTVRLLLRQDLPFRGECAVYPEVEAGRTTRVEVVLRRGVRVRGVVREQGTGLPIAGALVQFDTAPGTPRVRTDAEGRYTAYVEDYGGVTPLIAAVPKNYDYPLLTINTVPVPTGAMEVTAEPYILARGVSLRGRVLDKDGRAVPWAEVRALWTRPERYYEEVRSWTDRDGTFVLDGIESGAKVGVTAFAASGSAGPVAVRAGGTDPVTLVVNPAATLSLAGRVRDPAGRPVPGAIVRFRSRVPDPRGHRMFDRTLLLANRDSVRTGADGRFQTPGRLPPGFEFRAAVEALGYTSATSDWLEPAPGTTTSFPDFVLRPVPRLCEVSGRVVDRQGRPVAGAVVFQSGDGPHRTHTTTDTAGQFRLPGVFEGRAFLFVRAEGFLFEGHPVDVAGRGVELTIHRHFAEATRLATLPPVLTRPEEQALAERALRPVAVRVARGDVPEPVRRLVQAAAQVNPGLVLEWAESGVLADYTDTARLAAAEALFDKDLEGGLAIAETMPLARLRTQLYVQASDHVPTSDRARKKELLDTALLYARSDPSPYGKLDGLGRIGLRWLDLGERDKGVRILREGQAYAATLPAFDPKRPIGEGPSARGVFAAKLARIDAKAALELAEGFPDSYSDWFLGGVVLGLAECDPAHAERLSSRLRSGSYRLIRLSGRMAPFDLARARALAGQIREPQFRILALAAMVRSLIRPNPEAAAALLEETLTAMEDFDRAGQLVDLASRCVVAPSLLAVAEQLGPETLHRSFWRVLALRPPRPVRGNRDRRYEAASAQLAVLLARYDRAAARTVLGPAILRLAEPFDSRVTSLADTVYAAAVLIDPQWAFSLIEAAPDQYRDQARLTLAEVLGRTPAGRWDYLLEHYFYLRPDSRDDER
jgi:hypothetical protein